jgi:hypothetical protein
MHPGCDIRRRLNSRLAARRHVHPMVRRSVMTGSSGA